MSLEENNTKQIKEKDNSLDSFFFNLLIFTVIIIFPATLLFLTWMFW